MAEKKFFVDINLQGSALTNATIGTNSSLTKAGSFGFDGTRLKYFDGTAIKDVANLSDISAVTGGLIFQGGYDPTTDTPDITDGSALKGYFWAATAAGTFLGESVQVGDSIVAKVDNAGATIADWLILQGNIVIATDSVDGISRLATQTEANDGTEGGAVVITPATLQGKIDAQITPEISSKLPLAGGTMSGAINMGNNNITNVGNGTFDYVYTDRIAEKPGSSDIKVDIDLDFQNASQAINLPAPTSGGAATNKTYVDNADALKLSLSGGTMSGDIDMGQNTIINLFLENVRGIDMNGNSITNVSEPTLPYDATSKGYVDFSVSTAQANAIATASADATAKADAAEAAANAYTDTGLAAKLDLAGGTMSGTLDMDSNIINNLAEPINNNDAARKGYVDATAATAETNANAYTDTQVNLSSFRVELEVGDWTLNGSTYEATVTHNILNTPYPVVTFTDHLEFTVELVYQAISGTAIKVFSNILPTLIGVSLGAAAPRA
jgi:hypothetical protein